MRYRGFIYVVPRSLLEQVSALYLPTFIIPIFRSFWELAARQESSLGVLSLNSMGAIHSLKAGPQISQVFGFQNYCQGVTFSERDFARTRDEFLARGAADCILMNPDKSADEQLLQLYLSLC